MGAMLIEYDAVQFRRIIGNFERLSAAAEDTRPVMVDVAAIMMAALGKQFESGGRRGGGSWKSLTVEWLTRKQRMNLDPRIGFATHRLFKSVTEVGAEGQTLEIGDNFVHLETTLPYARTQQEHRPFARFTAGDRLAMRRRIATYLFEAWQAG